MMGAMFRSSSWFAAAVLAVAVGGVPDASANGRFPAQQDILFQPGKPSTIYAPVTFGLMVSTDDGASFRWVCEEAIPYGGKFDPDYVASASGKLWATTYDGTRVTTDHG